jgi:ATP-dependent Lon protease
MTESDRPEKSRPVARSRSPVEKPAAEAADMPQVAAEAMAVLPLRDIVVFPHMIVPLFVGREKSVRALEAVMKEDKQILLVAQKNAAQDDPEPGDIYRIGTVSTILQLLKLPDGTVKVLVEGGRRAHHRLQGDGCIL